MEFGVDASIGGFARAQGRPLIALESIIDAYAALAAEREALGWAHVREVASERNVRFTKNLMALYEQKGPTFGAIGADHVVGPNSVVTQLQQAGARVSAPWPSRPSVSPASP